MMHLIKKRLFSAFSTFPTATNWQRVSFPLLGLSGLLLLIGFTSGFLKVEVLRSSWQEITKIVAVAFVAPALGEEIVFRVLCLPHPTENPAMKTQLFWGATALVAFIVYHPLQGLT